MDNNSGSFLATAALSLANVFFHIIHLAIIFFFLLGWLSERMLTAHFILSLLILLSWCGLGIFFGFGYCLVTDIQWRIKKLRGEKPHTQYYIKYMIDKITGFDTDGEAVNAVTTYTFFILLTVSTVLVLNRRFAFF